MNTTGCQGWQRSTAVAAVLAVFAGEAALAQPDFAIFLDSYPNGDLHLVELPDLDAPQIKTVRPATLRLDLSRKLARRFQVANGDVHSDGSNRNIVFGGRTDANADWDIYLADVNVSTRVLENVRPLVANGGVREEDPRFSWDGLQVVYKCDGKICMTNSDGSNTREVVAKDGCELWAPALDVSGFVLTYVERCADAESDRVVRHSLLDGERTVVSNTGGGPDRFPHFTLAGEIVYSHVDNATATASLWQYTHPSGTALMHDETGSDDDPYVYRNDATYIAFSGWLRNAYSLFVYRRDTREAVQLTQRINVLGSILFD